MAGTDLTAVIERSPKRWPTTRRTVPPAAETADLVGAPTDPRRRCRGDARTARLHGLRRRGPRQPASVCWPDPRRSGRGAWAVLLVDRSVPVTDVIGCAIAPRDHEQLGLEVAPLAGRVTADRGRASRCRDRQRRSRDNPETLFHQVATMLMARGGLPHLQLHGFADVRAPGTDVVLSSGPSSR